MPLPLRVVLALAEACAPSVAAQTLTSIVRVESAFDPLAIGINGPNPRRIHPRTVDEAIRTATHLVNSGANVDLGLGQINSSNLTRLNLTIADAFEPCRNLRGTGQVLEAAYRSQAPASGQEQAGLRRALSIYNTGHTDRGFRNGYVAKVSAAAGAPMAPSPPPSSTIPEAPAWDVFGHAGSVRLVFTPTTSGDTP